MTARPSGEVNLAPEVLDLLRDPGLFERIDAAIEDSGLVGEDLNRRTLFLAGLAGKLGIPIHGVVHGESAGGKNTLVRKALGLLPESDVTFTSSLSRKALAYQKRAIRGVLVIDEAEGAVDAEYLLRQAMSEGRVTHMTVNKGEDGRWEDETKTVEVSASVITTTTAERLHPENQTRVFDLRIDDGEEQTQRVLESITRREMGEAPPPREESWVCRTAIAALQPREVVIPFLPAFRDRFPTKHVRVRRDFERSVRMIRASALLHQYQRDHDSDSRVIATVEDYRLVYPLLQHVLPQSITGLTDKAFEICDLHDELAEIGGSWVWRIDLEKEASRRNIASPNTVRKWCKILSEFGIWEGEITARKWRHRKLQDPREEPVSLPRPEDLPTTSQSAIGRQKASNDAGILARPSQDDEETGRHDVDTAGSPSFLETDWEASAGTEISTATRSPARPCSIPVIVGRKCDRRGG